MSTHSSGGTLHRFWRWLVSYDARERLNIAAVAIVRDRRLDTAHFDVALDAAAQYMVMIYAGEKRAAHEFYERAISGYPTEIRKLAVCVTLLRHGLFTGRLPARDYDLVQKRCRRMSGGTSLRPFLSKITRSSRG